MRSLSEKRSETRKISHNLEGSGSNPLPATFKSAFSGAFLFGDSHTYLFSLSIHSQKFATHIAFFAIKD